MQIHAKPANSRICVWDTVISMVANAWYPLHFNRLRINYIMEKIYAYLDECGGYGFKDSVMNQESMFIVSAIIIKESDLETVDSALKTISKEEFCGQEIKSNRIKGNHPRRVRILNKVLKLPFNILCLIVDKRAILSEHGVRRSKKYFYEFLNQLIYNELRGAYPSLHIVTDEIGNPEFADEFTKYVKSHRIPINLFDSEVFDVVNSKFVNAIQLADLIAGTLSYVYEEKKRKRIPDGTNYLNMIEKKILRTKFFPKSYDETLFEHPEGNNNYNLKIAQIAYRKAEQFINNHTRSEDEFIRRQVFTLKYLLFRFKYNSLRRYISTKELMSALLRANYGHISEQAFRSKVIGTLRDKGVIISSSPKGYKLPSSEKEIYDYYQHVSGVVLPMIHRLNLCNESLRLGSNNSLDYLRNNDFKGLHIIVDAIKKEVHKS